MFVLFGWFLNLSRICEIATSLVYSVLWSEVTEVHKGYMALLRAYSLDRLNTKKSQVLSNPISLFVSLWSAVLYDAVPKILLYTVTINLVHLLPLHFSLKAVLLQSSRLVFWEIIIFPLHFIKWRCWFITLFFFFNSFQRSVNRFG